MKRAEKSLPFVSFQERETNEPVFCKMLSGDTLATLDAWGEFFVLEDSCGHSHFGTISTIQHLNFIGAKIASDQSNWKLVISPVFGYRNEALCESDYWWIVIVASL